VARVLLRLTAMRALVLLAACSGDAFAPELSRLQTVELISDHRTRSRVTVPADWPCNERGCFVRNSWGEAVIGIELVAFPGSHDTLDRMIEELPETERRPNTDTGDPALDRVRLDVVLVERGELPDGAYSVVRVTRPPEVVGPYRDRLVARCARMEPSGTRFVYATAWSWLVHEAHHGAAVIAACKSLQL
jgi:hypothetical protein